MLDAVLALRYMQALRSIATCCLLFAQCTVHRTGFLTCSASGHAPESSAYSIGFQTAVPGHAPSQVARFVVAELQRVQDKLAGRQGPSEPRDLLTLPSGQAGPQQQQQQEQLQQLAYCRHLVTPATKLAPRRVTSEWRDVSPAAGRGLEVVEQVKRLPL